MQCLLRSMKSFGALFLSLGLLVGMAGALSAQTPTTDTIESPVVDADGNTVGMLYAGQSNSGVTLTVLLDAGALAPGEHGVHIHETGSCDPSGETTFSLAGAHFNPTDTHHGAPGSDMSHAGDLGNLTVAEDGSAQFSITTDSVTLVSGETNSLTDVDGAALVIHAGVDDLTTDPSGESGGRLLCSVISPATAEITAATPAA